MIRNLVLAAMLLAPLTAAAQDLPTAPYLPLDLATKAADAALKACAAEGHNVSVAVVGRHRRQVRRGRVEGDRGSRVDLHRSIASGRFGDRLLPVMAIAVLPTAICLMKWALPVEGGSNR